MSQIVSMTDILKPAELGVAKLGHVVVTKLDAMRDAFHRIYTVPGTYVTLHVGDTLMMSDTMDERRSNRQVVSNAKGDVLIAGLGLGMILRPILAKEGVTSVTVIEKCADVIKLISPHFPSPKLTVIEADIFEWKPERGRKFDTIYFDIWSTIESSNGPEITKLKRRFARCKNQGGWMGAWCEWDVRHP